jgi:hypothetical protein
LMGLVSDTREVGSIMVALTCIERCLHSCLRSFTVSFWTIPFSLCLFASEEHPFFGLIRFA